MTKPYEACVNEARELTRKTFHDRMRIAELSFEAVAEDGKGAQVGEPTLSDFASDIGEAYQTLDSFRRVWTWLGRDFLHVEEIGTYSLAREAMNSGTWMTGAEFARFLAETDPPEPYTRWTVDALRTRHGQKVTRRAPERTFLQKLTNSAWDFWKLQDELRDLALGDEEREQARAVFRATARFAQAAERALDTGNFDEEVAELLAEFSKES